MNLSRQALRIFREEGALTLLTRGSKYAASTASCYLWRLLYAAKAELLNDYTISIHGVTIDLATDALSAPMRRKLRTRRYEAVETEFIRSYLDASRPTIDLGAGIGYTTCLVDEHTDEGVGVVGVEANGRLMPVIERTRQLNDAEFDVVHAAYSADGDTIDLQLTDKYWGTSRYGEDDNAKITVPASSLEELLEQTTISTPFQLVADIEGSEAELIENEANLLQTGCSRVIMEFHQVMGHDPGHYESQLRQLGFERIDSHGTVGVYSNSRLDTHT